MLFWPMFDYFSEPSRESAGPSRRAKLRLIQGGKVGYDLLELQEEQRRVATDIAIAAGVLHVCEFHGVAYQSGAPMDTAYKIASARFSRGQIESGLFKTQRELTDAVKSAVADQAAFGCPVSDCPHS